MLYRTAHDDGERGLTEEETAEYATHRAEYDRLNAEVDEINAVNAAVMHRSGHEALRQVAAPLLVGRVEEPASATRSLDELYWASVTDVVAGSYGASQEFMANPYGARNRVEPTLVRSQSGMFLPAPLIDEFSPDHGRMIRSFQKLVGDMILFGLVTSKRGSLGSGEAFLAARAHPAFHDRYENILRAMDVDTAAEGLEWVPTGIGASLHEKVRAAGKVAPLFTRINMPTSPWKWPLEAADATAFRVPEPTGDTEAKFAASTPGTGAATFDAEIFGARALTSKTLEALSAIAILPYMSNKIAQAFSDAEEKAILAGDTDGTHQDSDIGASTTDARTAWDGLRKKALAETSTDALNVAVTRALLNTSKAKMGKYGLNPAEMAHIIGVRDYYNLADDADFRTIDKFGPKAIVLNGQLGAADGTPVIVSEHIREDLNASGVQDGVTTDRSHVLTVNRGEWAIGQREALDVEVDDSIYRETYQRLVIGFALEDFQHIGDAAANDDTAILFNTAP